MAAKLRRMRFGTNVKLWAECQRKTVQPTKSQKNAKKVLTRGKKGDIIIKLSNARGKQR